MKWIWWALAAGLALLLWVPSGQAAHMGPCEGVIGGAALSEDGQRIIVPADGAIDYQFDAQSPVDSWEVDLAFGGFDARVSEGSTTSEQTSVAGSADIADYAVFGAGLYQVDAVVRLVDGNTCTASVLIEVDQNPLTTAAGWVAVAAGAGGVTMAAAGSAVAAKAALAALAA